MLTHSAAGHLPAPSSSLLCTAPALPDLPAQQWEDFPSAVTQSHTNPNVFTESRRLKKANIFRGFPKPELGALVHQPPLMCLGHVAEGLTGDLALLIALKVGELLPWNDFSSMRILNFFKWESSRRNKD